MWIVIDATVYNVSKFMELVSGAPHAPPAPSTDDLAFQHPGGESVFYDEEVAGSECTEIFL